MITKLRIEQGILSVAEIEYKKGGGFIFKLLQHFK